MSKECAICRTDMDTLAFEPQKDMEDDVAITETCMRLKCGHAFHSSCIALAFRANVKCPMCRDNPEEEDNENSFLQLLPPNMDNFQALVAVSREELNQIESSITCVEQIRQTNYQVQRARAKFNKEKLKAFQTIQKLESERKLALNKAMNVFRKEHRVEWERLRRHLQRQVTKIRKLEYDAMVHTVGQEKATQNLETLNYSNMYDLRRIMSNAEPFRKRFWVR